ncbi:hypothetical protein BDN72DRAFT_846284 [Pluteus cervinus]|uniref:Uncharacterized protein n=1 Tax=Pluteus cervinus TaxID=181527 RepID=A0ACD3AHK7_9AGAR|nr:hypothetical protein BDN72DRAFT_846284 [Pluteus cervinus]
MKCIRIRNPLAEYFDPLFALSQEFSERHTCLSLPCGLENPSQPILRVDITASMGEAPFQVWQLGGFQWRWNLGQNIRPYPRGVRPRRCTGCPKVCSAVPNIEADILSGRNRSPQQCNPTSGSMERRCKTSRRSESHGKMVRSRCQRNEMGIRRSCSDRSV